MTLEKLLGWVRKSSSDDWHQIPCWGHGAGPSYRPRFTVRHGVRGQTYVDIDEHPYVAVYRPDIAVTLAWGLVSSDRFEEDWLKVFPTSSASSEYGDLFYNGALVFRFMFLSVDGGRGYLPFPDGQEFRTVLALENDLVRLVHGLTNADPYEDYFERAGLVVR